MRAMADLQGRTASPQREPAALRARRLVERLGGRYSRELGIDLDRGGDEIERWALAATLFGNRISAGIAMRTYRVLARTGVRTLADARERGWDDLVALLDEGGYARYDFRTATRLHALAQAVGERHGGRIAALGGALCRPAELEVALDALPGWGPVTVRLFLRELRGVWPGADPPIDERALEAARHLGLVRPAGAPAEARARLRRLAVRAGVDERDLEVALVRASLAHARSVRACPGGASCELLLRSGRLSPEPPHATSSSTSPRRGRPSPG